MTSLALKTATCIALAIPSVALAGTGQQLSTAENQAKVLYSNSKSSGNDGPLYPYSNPHGVGPYNDSR